MLTWRSVDLVLVDEPLEFGNLSTVAAHCITIDSPSGTVLAEDRDDGPFSDFFKPVDALTKAIEHFTPDDVLDLIGTRPTRASRVDITFHWLLVVGEWQQTMEQVEREVRRLQYSATESLDKKTLIEMGDFRRRLADLRERLANAEKQILQDSLPSKWEKRSNEHVSLRT